MKLKVDIHIFEVSVKLIFYSYIYNFKLFDTTCNYAGITLVFCQNIFDNGNRYYGPR